MKSVLFLRDFRQFTGGHLKVWHYFNHVLAAEGFEPRIWFTDDSAWDESNPWLHMNPSLKVKSPCISDADVLFLAGLDWLQLTPAQREQPDQPIINFIQHVRHADPEQQLSQFLKYEAIRICVSQEVADAIQATGRVRGPVHVICNGLDLGALPAPRKWDERRTDLLILANKRVYLGKLCAALLWRPWRRLRLITDPVPRSNLMEVIADSRRVLLLPHETEGFYLPALEAMAAGSLVICPDCVGNRRFCLDDQNCMRPEYNLREILRAVRRAWRKDGAECNAMLKAAHETAQDHDLDREREQFHKLLADSDLLRPS